MKVKERMLNIVGVKKRDGAKLSPLPTPNTHTHTHTHHYCKGLVKGRGGF